MLLCLETEHASFLTVRFFSFHVLSLWAHHRRRAFWLHAHLYQILAVLIHHTNSQKFQNNIAKNWSRALRPSNLTNIYIYILLKSGEVIVSSKYRHGEIKYRYRESSKNHGFGDFYGYLSHAICHICLCQKLNDVFVFRTSGMRAKERTERWSSMHLPIYS